MRSVKVCFVSLYAYHLFNPASYSRFGGAELQLYYLSIALATDVNFEVNFIVGDFGQARSEHFRGVNLYKFYNPRRKLKYTGMLLGLIRLWRLLYNINADVYVQRAAGLETGVVALFCRFYRKRFIYMIAHDDDVTGQKPRWMLPGFLGNIRWRLFYFGLKYAHLVIGQHTEQLKNLKINYGKAGLLRNSAHPISENIPLGQKDCILWVARAEDWKQPEFFLDMAKKFPLQSFIMIMPEAGSEEFFKRIRNEAKQISNLDFYEFVSFNKIDEFFLKAKIFVNTSLVEGFPNTFIQAAKSKTPILSLNVNPDNMLEKHQMGFCAKGDLKELRQNLEKLLLDDGLRIQMGENGYQYAKENHDLKKIVEEDKKIIQTIVSTKDAA